jgi:hypothetical protein
VHDSLPQHDEAGAAEIDADHDPVPEPRGSVMLIAGAVFLGLLYRRRVRGLRLG